MTFQDFLIASFFTILLGSLFLVPILATHNMKKALRQAASQLQLQRSEISGDPRMFDVEAYEGTYKGFRVRLTKGWRIYAAGATPVPIQGIFVEAFLSTPIPFPIEIARKGTPIFPHCPTGDAEFDKHCVVVSEAKAEVEKLLENLPLRRQLQTFLLSQKGMARITSEAVTTKFVNAWKGAPLLLGAIYECARVAHALSK